MGRYGGMTMSEHDDWKYDVKISNDNAKNEKRVTVHARSDDTLDEAVKDANKLYKDSLEWNVQIAT